jgi:hypothetical protein
MGLLAFLWTIPSFGDLHTACLLAYILTSLPTPLEIIFPPFFLGFLPLGLLLGFLAFY